MRYDKHQVLSFFVTISSLCTLKFVRSTTNSKRFIVVSGQAEAKKIFYQTFRNLPKKPHQIRPFDTREELEVKKQICQDVSNSYAFRQNGKLSYEKYADPVTRLLKNFKYPTVSIPLVQLESEPYETTFQCLAQESWDNVRFYVSDEYDLDTDSNSPHHMVGRFIFHSFANDWPVIYALAEIPASAFSSPDYNIESVYLQRRGSENAAPTAEEDTLCGLSKDRIQRICVAVFNSEYFEEKFEFSNVYEVKSYCELKAVSFQTDEGKTEAAGRRLEEWMLSCKPDENESIFEYWESRWMLSCRPSDEKECTFHYWLTYAHHTNQIFVHFWDSDSGNVYLENLNATVRLTEDDKPTKPQRVDSRIDENESSASHKRTRFDSMSWADDNFMSKITKKGRSTYE